MSHLKVIQEYSISVFNRKSERRGRRAHMAYIEYRVPEISRQEPQILIMFDCDPAKANDLKAIIYKELDKNNHLSDPQRKPW